MDPGNCREGLEPCRAEHSPLSTPKIPQEQLWNPKEMCSEVQAWAAALPQGGEINPHNLWGFPRAHNRFGLSCFCSRTVSAQAPRGV